MSDDEVADLRVEFDKERERHGAETFELYHEMVVDMRSMLVHL